MLAGGRCPYAGWVDVMRLADWSWPVLRRVMAGHSLIYRASGGLIGHRFPGAPPMLLLDHVGAKSGTRRTTPLVYVKDGRDVVIVASRGGPNRQPPRDHKPRAPPPTTPQIRPAHPAHPDTTVQIGREHRAVHARVAGPDEHARLWPKAVATYDGYRGYQRRTERQIPLIILEPRA